MKLYFCPFTSPGRIERDTDEIENSSSGIFLKKLGQHRILPPEPDGPDIMISVPLFIVVHLIFRRIIVIKTGGYGLRLEICQHYKVTVGYYNRPCSSAVRGIYKCPFSLAFWIIRFIGADSGLTMATRRDADIIFPKPMFISFKK